MNIIDEDPVALRSSLQDCPGHLGDITSARRAVEDISSVSCRTDMSISLDSIHLLLAVNVVSLDHEDRPKPRRLIVS